MPNGKCRMHGGSSTGAPDDNQNARKHGLFSKCLNEHGAEVYRQTATITPEQKQEDAANFLLAQIAQAYETNEHIDKAKNQVEEVILAMIDEEKLSAKYGYSLINRLRQPDIGTLGKALSPLKGLLDKKKEEGISSEERDDDGMSIVPEDSPDWKKFARGPRDGMDA